MRIEGAEPNGKVSMNVKHNLIKPLEKISVSFPALHSYLSLSLLSNGFSFGSTGAKKGSHFPLLPPARAITFSVRKDLCRKIKRFRE